MEASISVIIIASVVCGLLSIVYMLSDLPVVGYESLVLLVASAGSLCTHYVRNISTASRRCTLDKSILFLGNLVTWTAFLALWWWNSILEISLFEIYFNSSEIHPLHGCRYPYCKLTFWGTMLCFFVGMSLKYRSWKNAINFRADERSDCHQLLTTANYTFRELPSHFFHSRFNWLASHHISQSNL